jgi:alpha-tubulin suppressor-like RCC1 family protein
MRSVAAGRCHSLAFDWNGCAYSWGSNKFGQLGHEDRLLRPSLALVKGLEGVRSIAAIKVYSLAVTQSGAVFNWGTSTLCPEEEGSSTQSSEEEGSSTQSQEEEGSSTQSSEEEGSSTQSSEEEGSSTHSSEEEGSSSHSSEEEENLLRPTVVEGFGGLRVRRVLATWSYGRIAFAIGEEGELFSWGACDNGILGHGDTEAQTSPQRIEVHPIEHIQILRHHGWAASTQERLGQSHLVLTDLSRNNSIWLRGVRVSSVSAHGSYALLTEGGLLYAWGAETTTV